MHKDIIFYFKQNFSTTTTFLRFVVISEHVYHSLTFRKTSTTNDKYFSLCGYITDFIEIFIVVTLEIQLLVQEESLSDKIQLGLATSEAGTAYPSRAPEWGSCYSIFSFMCMFCRSLFVLLYFFFWSLCCQGFQSFL